jgi:hypothetical protein
MHVIEASNVNVAYQLGLSLLLHEGEQQHSRAGDVLVMPYPVVTKYTKPWQRVLFDHNRDANPFFHLFEALWMLAGRNDAKWLDQFVSDFSGRFAEADGRQHGAYGWRWRRHPDGEPTGRNDQLTYVIEALKKDPTDRRVVIQMWSARSDLGADKRDLPCNLCVVPRIIAGKLDITVMCRSNDAVWGAYGANAVHFAFLQEYLAAMISVDTGTYYQISNNFHVYNNVLDKVRVGGTMVDPYAADGHRNYCHPLIEDRAIFDSELFGFLYSPESYHIYENSFFNNVARPMYRAHKAYKLKHWNAAFEFLAAMPEHNDWRKAAYEWLDRRYRKSLERGEQNECE